MIVALDLLSGLAEGLNGYFRPLIEQSHCNLVELLHECCQVTHSRVHRRPTSTPTQFILTSWLALHNYHFARLQGKQVLLLGL